MVQPRQHVVPQSKQPNSASSLATSCPHPHRIVIVASVDVRRIRGASSVHSLCRRLPRTGKLIVFIGPIKFLDQKDLSHRV